MSIKNCLFCNEKFDSINNKKCCSRRCASKQAHKFNVITDEFRNKMKLVCFRPEKMGKIKNCLFCKKEFYSPKCLESKKYCSKDCANSELSKNLKGRCGGYRHNSGRSKSGWYKGIFCGSSYELAYVIYLIDNKIEFKRNNQGFDYIFNGVSKKYYPDFIVNDEYIEIK